MGEEISLEIYIKARNAKPALRASSDGTEAGLHEGRSEKKQIIS